MTGSARSQATRPVTGSAAEAADPDPLTLERMRWWDLTEVHALEGPLFGEHAWSLGQLWAELARVPESRWYLVARRGSRVVGYAGLFVVAPDADIQTVAVADSEQGRGTGRRLVTALLDRAQAAGASRVHLEVRADNAPALALYGSLGFTVDGRRPDYYGRGLDGVLMTIRLAER